MECFFSRVNRMNVFRTIVDYTNQLHQPILCSIFINNTRKVTHLQSVLQAFGYIVSVTKNILQWRKLQWGGVFFCSSSRQIAMCFLCCLYIPAAAPFEPSFRITLMWMCIYAKKYPLRHRTRAVMSWIMHWKFEHFPNKWKMLKTKSNIRFMYVCECGRFLLFRNRVVCVLIWLFLSTLFAQYVLYHFTFIASSVISTTNKREKKNREQQQHRKKSGRHTHKREQERGK